MHDTFETPSALAGPSTMAVYETPLPNSVGPDCSADHIGLEDELPEFTPMTWTLKEIREAIPAHLFERHTSLGLLYFTRDLLLAASFFTLGTFIDPVTSELVPQPYRRVVRWLCWCTYWWFQGLAFTGLWVIGHECGHGAFSPNAAVCNALGFVIHSLLWTPYFAWRISHHRHHANHASMERDEVYVPKCRSDLGLPQEHELHENGLAIEELLGDTPVYTLFMLVRQQLLAFPAYLLFNVSGQKSYPKWTSHFLPSSVIFKPTQRNDVIISNIGILCAALVCFYACRLFGALQVIRYYGIPWLFVTHWFIMITYLQHTDPHLPHYRGPAWNFQRGAASTVDRDFLGWQGRFFLHDVAHYHVIHHFFPLIPFYNGKEATEHLKTFIGKHYHRSSEPVFQQLWRAYNECQFVDDDGDIVFYRNRTGKASRKPAAGAR